MDEAYPSVMGYYDVLKKIHGILKPKTYLEIGIRNGDSFQIASPQTLCIGIDPNPQINVPLNANAKIFKTTSDEFFHAHDIKQLLGGQHIDLAFIDGMHLFEYAFRDFVNLERYLRIILL